MRNWKDTAGGKSILYYFRPFVKEISLYENSTHALPKKQNTKINTPPLLFRDTQQVIEEIEQICDGDFLTYWTSDKSRIAEEDVVAIDRVLKHLDRKRKLYFFVKSDGGSGEGALRIVHLLRHYYREIEALVPLDCASAATMLVLGADLIHMGPMAYLSAVDTSITHALSPLDSYNDLVSVSQNELDRVIRPWEQKNNTARKKKYSRSSRCRANRSFTRTTKTGAI